MRSRTYHAHSSKEPTSKKMSVASVRLAVRANALCLFLSAVCVGGVVVSICKLSLLAAAF